MPKHKVQENLPLFLSRRGELLVRLKTGRFARLEECDIDGLRAFGQDILNIARFAAEFKDRKAEKDPDAKRERDRRCERSERAAAKDVTIPPVPVKPDPVKALKDRLGSDEAEEAR